MGIWRWLGVFALAIQPQARSGAQEAPPPDVLHVSSKLVVVDATVVDKAGRPVGQLLSKDDFLVKEDEEAQSLYSFESAAEHAQASARGSEEPTLMVFVLDELNYQFLHVPTRGSIDAWNMQRQAMQYHYAREHLASFLRDQPARLRKQTEVLALTHHGFVVVAAKTQDRDEVLKAVQQRDPHLGSPFRDYLEETGAGDGARDYTLTKDSFRAIWALALQLRGVRGRKLVLWLGDGGPDLVSSKPVSGENLTPTQRHVRQIVDLLVDARVTLDICGFGITVEEPGFQAGAMKANAAAVQPGSYGYDKDFGFGGFVAATGGTWLNGNDIRGEIQTAAELDDWNYTISYRPTNHDSNGDFRHIQVRVKGHPEWRVISKSGYFAMQYGGEKDQMHQLQTDMVVAGLEAMPFVGIGATLVSVERLGGTEMTRFTFRLDADDLDWSVDPQQSLRRAQVAVEGMALGAVTKEDALASRAVQWNLSLPLQAAGGTRILQCVLDFADCAEDEEISLRVRRSGKRETGCDQLAVNGDDRCPECRSAIAGVGNSPEQSRAAVTLLSDWRGISR